MIRVLHIVTAMNRGGLETFIMNIYRNIDRNKVQFDFLVHTDKESDYDQEIKTLGGRIYSVPPRKKGVFKNYRALNIFFKRHPEYKVVHQHVSSLTYIEPLKAAKRNGISTRIIHCHSTRQGGNPLHKYIHYFNRFFVRFYVTDYFSCSDLASEWLLGKRRYSKNECTIINNGIDVDNFMFNPQIRKEYRKKLKIDDNFVIGHVGRFSYPKNHDFLIDIFKSFSETRPDSILLLIGDGELRTNIEKKCEELKLKERVIFTGVRTDISSLLQSMDVFVFPSYYEGLPVTLVEAQASGLMCFVSDSITKQINITKLINNISLDFSAEQWSDSIIQADNMYTRNNIGNIVKNSGFDINKVAKELIEYYTFNSKENEQ